MEVIYVDNHLFAAIKPAGLATQPEREDTDDFLRRAKKWIKEQYQKKGNVFLEPIHRLDKPVRGIVLFARTSKALSRLQAQMREKKIQKSYAALIEGKLPELEGTLEHYLLHASHRALIVSSERPLAKQARLHYRTIQKHSQGTWIEITLETGRYHQIRAQLAAIGCPVIGDRKYGNPLPWERGAIALYHVKMVITHPVTEQEIILQDNKLLSDQKLQIQAISPV